MLKRISVGEVYLIFKPLVVHPESLAAFVGPRQTFAEEMTAINVVPRLPDELVFHVKTVGLQIAPDGRQFFVVQDGRMVLKEYNFK